MLENAKIFAFSATVSPLLLAKFIVHGHKKGLVSKLFYSYKAVRACFIKILENCLL